MAHSDILLFWAAVILYGASGVIYAIAAVFRKHPLLRAGAWIAAAGLACHAAAIGLRWHQTGHGPYVSRYEVFSSDAWVAVAVFLIAQAAYAQVRSFGAGVFLLVFILLGFSFMSSPEMKALPPSLRSVWLILHIGFAKLALGSIFIGFAASVAYLGKRGDPDSLSSLDLTAYRFIALGFLFMGVMIASGAIWADSAWGRYWGWDPVETWSLIAWLTYGVYLHGRLLRSWKGRGSAWFGAISLPIVFIAYFGVTILTQSIHSAYLVK